MIDVSNAKRKILIVDDEPVNIFFLEGLLNEEGFDVCSAFNGVDALRLVKEFTPDVILLDIMMPDISGLEVLEKLIADHVTCHIPVIMVTARNEAEDVELALSKGAVEYIKKPVNEIELIARLRTVIRLKIKEDELKELLQSKEDFIHMVSHDVRAPFLSISGLAEMLLNDSELNKKMNNENKEILSIIIDSSNFIVDYFNKLLNWSNLGSKELLLSKSEINILKLIHTSNMVYSNKIAKKNQMFSIVCDRSLNIFADASYIQQVINNLLSNAIKFTPDGGSVSINVENTGKNIFIKVADTGIGMPDISDDELFGSSFHKSTRGTRGEKGTGVGLRICKMITDAHGFGLTYDTVKGKGTEFIISVPL